MLDDESMIASILLERIGATNEALIELAQDIRSRPEVSQVVRSLDVRKYKTGPVLEAYVDVETYRAKAFCWWLEVRWDETQWIVEYSVRSHHQYGQDVVIEFPERVSKSLEEFLGNLEHATQDLVVSAKMFNFSK